MEFQRSLEGADGLERGRERGSEGPILNWELRGAMPPGPRANRAITRPPFRRCPQRWGYSVTRSWLKANKRHLSEGK